MAKKKVETRIREEEQRLTDILKDLDKNKLAASAGLISDMAFQRISMDDLKEEINREGWKEEYQNGANQYGTKQSVSGATYISLQKLYATNVKVLLDIVPPAQRESRLAAMMAK